MKKKLGILLLSAALSLGTIAPCYAALPEDGLMPLYDNINDLKASFSVSDEGKATYKVNVTTSSATEITASIEIQQNISGKWKTIHNDSKTVSRKLLGIGDDIYVDPDGTYRMKYTVDVTYGSNDDVETVTKYIYSK